MKKLIVGSIIALTISTIPVCVMAEGVATITGNNVNVRSEANATSTVYATVAEGSQFTIIGQEDDYYVVDFIGENAYISNQYVKFLEADLTVEADALNIRREANENSNIIRQANKGETFVAVSKTSDGKWYKIKLGVDYGFLYKDYVAGEFLSRLPVEKEDKIKDTYALVTASGTLNIRTAPSTDADKAGTISNGYIVDVIEQVNSGEWLKIKTDDGTIGYVYGEHVSIRSGEKPSRSSASKGQEIVEYAMQFKGTPYVWGGTNLNKGVDCSGFVYSVYKNFGITLNRTSASMPSNGTKVSKSELQAGDLVFFATGKGSKISHVGIYAGGGTFIHSSSSRTGGVIVSDITSGYYNNTYVTACRILR